MDYDRTLPGATTVTIASNNANTAIATTGDVITVSFTVDDEMLATPTATIDSIGATVTVDGAHPNYKATHTATGTTTEGLVTFTLDFTDEAGNPATQVAAVTDTSLVSVDRTPPTATSVTIVSDNANTRKAKTGDEITISFTVDDDMLAMPTATIQTKTAVVAVDGAHPNYTAKYSMIGTDTEGDISFTLDFDDEAGAKALGEFLHSDAGVSSRKRLM